MGGAGQRAAYEAGRFVGSLLDCNADMCPIPPGKRQTLRDVWMIGFSEGRMARIRLTDTLWPTIEISLSALRKAAEV